MVFGCCVAVRVVSRLACDRARLTPFPLERKGIIATGTRQAVAQAATDVLRQKSDRFILGADCTVPGDTDWDNLQTAIATAHNYL